MGVDRCRGRGPGGRPGGRPGGCLEETLVAHRQSVINVLVQVSLDCLLLGLQIRPLILQLQDPLANLLQGFLQLGILSRLLPPLELSRLSLSDLPLGHLLSEPLFIGRIRLERLLQVI